MNGKVANLAPLQSPILMTNINDRKLSTNQLGRLGEIFIDSLATEAGLTIETPIPDISGVDRTIKWPINYGPLISHDKHSGSKVFYLQIKSTNIRSSTVKLKLSAAHHLIQTNYPAAICVPIYDSKTPVKIVMFHIGNKEMDRILKRLRQCTKKNKNPRNSMITFNLSKGAHLKPEAEQFKNT